MAARKHRNNDSATETKAAPRHERPACAVVGIGASAGGLEALQKFFHALPPDAGLAFVIITHLDPERESHFAHVLGRHTALPVVEAADGVPVAPNRVYVIPPGKYLALQGGVLRLSDIPHADLPRVPIDFFFRSLAEDCRARAVGIVLSGTGSEGA